jgi:ATP-dependent DNA helicase DinG
MAEAVERALFDERHLFVEAGTGTGKTMAYLVPAILSGRKVIVSTATRALQEQIFVKDLPLVAEALAAHGIEFRAALMKGLSNYLCLRRFGEARVGGRPPDAAFARIVDWAARTETGDRAELADLPEDAEVWREVASSSETRIGAACPHFEECFVTRMRREAEEAQIVVVNHHLFLADLALRSGPGGARATVLPPHDAVVFDEAHQLEDIATDFFGVRVSSARIDALARDAERSLAKVNALEALKSGPVRATLESLRTASRAFFERLAAAASATESRRVLAEADISAEVRGAHAELELRLDALEAVARARPEEALQLVARRAAETRDDLRGIVAGSRPDADGEVTDLVRWIDLRARSVSLGASPVDVGGTLRARLFDRVPSVVCTSATLATGNSFHFARARLGAPPEADELVVASPFDFASQAVLYLPDDLPDPADAGFDGAAASRIAELVAVSDGGAFVLCTSTRVMRTLNARLRGQVGDRPLLLQGERPKHLLLSRFRSSGRAVLVATMSFWEGVDVPGRALRLVIIDKIPFAPPHEPVVAARCARLDREGGSGFSQYSVPSAAMTLKQGFGRLIRTQHDVGAVAVLDKRIVRKGYGRALLAALPPARRVRTLDELRAAWAGLAHPAAPDASAAAVTSGAV